MKIIMLMLIMSVMLIGIDTADAGGNLSEPHKKCLFHGSVIDIVVPHDDCDFSSVLQSNAHQTIREYCFVSDQIQICYHPAQQRIPHDPDCFEEPVSMGEIFL